MEEVKTGGSSAQDAGMAPEPIDQNLENSQAEQTQEEIEESPKPSEGETQEELVEDNSTEESQESSEEGKAQYLREKQDKNAARKIQETASELAQARKRLQEYETAQEQIVRSDPNQLYSIAQTDPSLADRIVEKLFGETHGVTSLEELQLLAQRSNAPERDKPLYDQQIELMREVRILKEREKLREEEDMKRTINKFRQSHSDFTGSLKSKALEIQEKSKNAFTLEESYEMAKALMASKDPEELRKEGEERAIVRMATSKAGVRGGGENKVSMGKRVQLSNAQIEMARRFRNDPQKVYSN